MTGAKIDFSADFGGLDAGLLLPHFQALKLECPKFTLEAFPFPELAFCLRVDGSITSFGFSGPAFVSISSKGSWVSVDIGVPSHEREKGDVHVAQFIASALVDAVGLLQQKRSRRLAGVDWAAVRRVVEALGVAYVARMSDPATVPKGWG